MARPVKEGLQYFPFDVDFFNDDKIQLLSAHYKSLGENLVIRLFCKIYANGFFYKCSEDEIALLARSMADGTRPAEVKEIINASLHRNIFNKQLYDCFEILTSKGIQKRFIEATGRRKAVEIYSEFWLLDFKSLPANFTITPVDVNIYPNKCQHLPDNCIRQTAKSTQSKVKESKSKKIDNMGVCDPPATVPSLSSDSSKNKYPEQLFEIFSKQYLLIKGCEFHSSSRKQDQAHLLKAAQCVVIEAERSKQRKLDTAEALTTFEWFVQQALQITPKEDNYLHANIAPRFLDTQFNSIFLKITNRYKNERSSNQSSGQPSDSELFQSLNGTPAGSH